MSERPTLTLGLSTKESNVNALSMYRKAGFKDTGEMNDEEIVLKLDL